MEQADGMKGWRDEGMKTFCVTSGCALIFVDASMAEEPKLQYVLSGASEGGLPRVFLARTPEPF